MRRMTFLHWLLLPPALLVFGLSLWLLGAVLSTASPLVAVVGVFVVVVIAAWVVFARGRAKLSGSESAMMGRQTSKDGLL